MAKEDADPDSLLNFYRKAIALRKSLPAVRYGAYREYFHGSKKLYVYTRETEEQKILVISSFTEKETKIRIPRGYKVAEGELVLTNYNERDEKILKPYETRVYVFGK